jgi:hypothetical protein
MKIYTVAHVPDDLGNAWLQYLRDFDLAHPGCHFEVITDAPDMSLGEVVAVLKVAPEIPIREIWKR